MPQAPYPAAVLPVRPQAVTHDEATRALAFEVWALQAGRNHHRTATLLREMAEREARVRGAAAVEPTPSDEAIRRWARDNDWDLEADRRMQELAPALHDRITSMLWAAAPGAVDVLIGAQRGEFDGLKQEEIRARTGTAVETLRMLGFGSAAITREQVMPQRRAGEAADPATGQDAAAALLARMQARKTRAGRQRG